MYICRYVCMYACTYVRMYVWVYYVQCAACEDIVRESIADASQVNLKTFFRVISLEKADQYFNVLCQKVLHSVYKIS